MAEGQGNTPTSTGQGQGLAQVLSPVTGLVQQADMYEAGQRNILAKKKADEDAAKKAKQEQVDKIKKMAEVKTDGLFFRDIPLFKEKYNAFNDRWRGQEELVYKNPEALGRYLDELKELQLFVESSNQAGKFFTQQNPLMEKDDSGYTEKAKEDWNNWLLTPGEAPRPFYATKNVDLNKWNKTYLLDEAGNFKESIKNSWDSWKKNNVGSRLTEGIKKDLAKQFISSQVNSARPEVKAAIIENFGDLETYINDQTDIISEMYKKTEVSSGDKKQGDGDYENPISERDYVESNINSLFRVSGGGKIISEVGNIKGRTVDRGTVKDVTNLSNDMIDLSSGGSIKNLGSYEVTYGQMFIPNESVSGLEKGKKYMLGYYKDESDLNEDGEARVKNIAVPFDRFKGNKEFIKKGYFFDENVTSDNNTETKKVTTLSDIYKSN